VVRRAVLQRVQFLSRFETHCLSGSDADLGAGAGVAADARLAGAHAEDAETAQFNALAGGKGLLQAFEDRIHRSLCLGAGQARTLDHLMDDVLLNQRCNLAGATELDLQQPTGKMLQVLGCLWNSGNRPSGKFPLSRNFEVTFETIQAPVRNSPPAKSTL